MKQIKFILFGVIFLVSALLPTLFAPQAALADGESYRYTSPSEIVISGGDIQGSSTLTSASPAINAAYNGQVTPNGQSCYVIAIVSTFPDDFGRGQVVFTGETPDFGGNLPDGACRFDDNAFENLTNGAITIANQEAREDDDDDPDDPAARVVFVNSFAEDFQNAPAADTITISNSGGVISTATTDLVEARGPDTTTNEYETVQFFVDPGTYEVCSVAANTCQSITKVANRALGVELGGSRIVDTVGGVRARVGVRIFNPPDGYTVPPAGIEIRDGDTVIATAQTLDDNPYQCPMENGACTIAQTETTRYADADFTGIPPGTYQLCIIATDECVDFTKPEDSSVTVEIIAADSMTLTPLESFEGTDMPEDSCEGSVISLGWILCPVATFVLFGLESIVMDGIVSTILNFDALDSGSGQQAALNSIWVGFRTIANVGFVIAFFIIIYSAATGGLLSAYDVKKLVPRMVAGAVFVQLSFFICIQLVRLFNAMGESVARLMLAPIGVVDSQTGAVNAVFSGNEIGWGILGEAIQGIVSALILILIIIGAILSIIGVFLMILVFTLRNMALMVLTVISPLAFVSWILPNTEGMFKKWWGYYIQLLALFPIAMAFLSSGRLVSYIWTQGADTWSNQWLAMIALFAPYLVAPKMFSLAGSAVSGVVRGVQGAKDGVKQRTGQIRQTQFGKRAESKVRSGAASRLNQKYGVGGSKADTWRGKLVQTGYAQRATAQAQQTQRNIKLEDTRAARINIDANRSSARVGFDGGKLRNNEGKLVSESGAVLERGAPGVPRTGPPLKGDAAEIEYLTQILESDTATGEEQAAAVSTLLNVHSTNGNAVMAINNFMTGKEGLEGRSESDAAAGDLYSRILEESGGSLTAVPHLAYDNSSSTIAKLDASEVHAIKSGSVEAFMKNEEAGDALVDRTVEAIDSGTNESQFVRNSNVAIMYNNGTDAQKAKLKERFKIEISPLAEDDGGVRYIDDDTGEVKFGKQMKDSQGNDMVDASGQPIFEHRVTGRVRPDRRSEADGADGGGGA